MWYIYIYIYIYTYVYIHIHTYIYIYILYIGQFKCALRAHHFNFCFNLFSRSNDGTIHATIILKLRNYILQIWMQFTYFRRYRKSIFHVLFFQASKTFAAKIPKECPSFSLKLHWCFFSFFIQCGIFAQRIKSRFFIDDVYIVL